MLVFVCDSVFVLPIVAVKDDSTSVLGVGLLVDVFKAVLLVVIEGILVDVCKAVLLVVSEGILVDVCKTVLLAVDHGLLVIVMIFVLLANAKYRDKQQIMQGNW